MEVLARSHSDLRLNWQPPAWVGRYVGRRWEPVAWDCWALVWHVLTGHSPVHLDLARHDEVAALPVHERVHEIDQAIAGEEWIEIAPGQEQMLDVARMRWRGEPSHVAPIVAVNTILNVRIGRTTQLEDLRTSWEPDRVLGVYRHRGLA